jgi:hypothetical protein
MRILDDVTSTALRSVTVYLTVAEAHELRDKVASVLSSREVHHEHIPSDDFQKEITIAIYEDRPIQSFDQRSRRLILEDS